jgi:hypothetical protein
MLENGLSTIKFMQSHGHVHGGHKHSFMACRQNARSEVIINTLATSLFGSVGQRSFFCFLVGFLFFWNAVGQKKTLFLKILRRYMGRTK